MRRHFVDVRLSDGRIEGTVLYDPALHPDFPAPPEGRHRFDVTDDPVLATVPPSELFLRGYTCPEGALVAPPPRAPVLTRRQFLSRLTPAQYVALQAAGQDDPEMAHAAALAEIEGPRIDLGHPDTVAYLELAVAKGLLSQATIDAMRAWRASAR